MTETIEKSLLELDFASLTRRTFTPSPAAWEDQVLYFLLLDRFSAGNVFGYDPDRFMTHDPASGQWYNDPRWDGKPFAFKGFNDRDGQPSLPFDSADPSRMEAAWPDGAVWPREFQRPHLFLRKGHI